MFAEIAEQFYVQWYGWYYRNDFIDLSETVKRILFRLLEKKMTMIKRNTRSYPNLD
jgi:hypothetical protein